MIAGLIIAAPNILWQFQYNWPVIEHMRELRETQWVNVEVKDFLLSQEKEPYQYRHFIKP